MGVCEPYALALGELPIDSFQPWYIVMASGVRGRRCISLLIPVTNRTESPLGGSCQLVKLPFELLVQIRRVLLNPGGCCLT